MERVEGLEGIEGVRTRKYGKLCYQWTPSLRDLGVKVLSMSYISLDLLFIKDYPRLVLSFVEVGSLEVEK